MEVSRRQFIQLGGATAASAAVPGLIGGENLVSRPNVRWRAHSPAEMPQPDLATLLLNRAAFGPQPGDVEEARQKGVDWWIERQLDHEKIDNSQVEGLIANALPTINMAPRMLLRVGQNQNVAVQELRLATLYRMVFSPRLLHEVMVEFWSDHFSIYHAAEQAEYFKTVDDREVIRKYALGKFKDLLTASATSPAMLNYLNNDQSRKDRPNENYARESQELHTLGVATNDYPYSEQDVKEAARCLTGWNWDQRQTSQTYGEFEFRAGDHDNGSKQVLGQFVGANGAQNDGYQFIDILVNHEATAKHLAFKLVRRFVTDDPLGQTPDLVNRVVDSYKRSDGDIKELLSTIFRSTEFAKSYATYGGRLSRPMDLLARALRAANIAPEHFGLAYQGRDAALYQRLMKMLTNMGHIPFYWPTPDGFPDVKTAWSASTVMLTRWNFGLSLCGVGNGATGFGPELINGFKILSQTPANLMTAGEVVDFWIDRILHRAMDPADRDAIIDFLTSGGSASTPVDLANPGRLPEAVALIFDSPYFQWR